MTQFRAISPSAEFKVNWHPFYLDPTSQIEDKYSRYERKFGKERAAQIVPYMAQVGKAEGINFDYGGPIGPTALSHRLIKFASMQSPDLMDMTVESLFKSYFENQGNIFETGPLLKIAEDVGLDRSATETFLKDAIGAKEIDREVEKAQASGVHGVPDFTINGKFKLNGAQESDVFLNVFKKLAE